MKVPIFTLNAIVHHSDHWKDCGKKSPGNCSSTTNLKVVNCPECLKKLKR